MNHRQFAERNHEYSKITISYRECEGKLDEAAQAEFGPKAKALAPTYRADCFKQRLKSALFANLHDIEARLKIRTDLPIYLFSRSEDPVGEQLKGNEVQLERYCEAGVRDVSHDFYSGGRHEMLTS